MTAEIAIINRAAIALAADSAVTYNMPGQPSKMSYSADKLFHLVCDQPVGIMVHGNAEYMGIPFEAIIKDFRASDYAEPKAKLSEYSDAFFSFMLREVPLSRSYLDENIESIVRGQLETISDKLSERLRTRGSKEINSKRGFEKFVETEVANLGKALVSRLENLGDNKYVNTIESPGHTDLVRHLIADIFPEHLSEETIDILYKVALLTLKKDWFSEGLSGLVFAGFGTADVFPALVAFDVDGLVGGGIKRRQTKNIVVDRDGDAAFIEAFAQQEEMIDRFLDGIDPEFEKQINSSILNAVNAATADVLTLLNVGSRRRTGLSKALQTIASKRMEEIKAETSERKKDDFRKKVIDIVHFMSKPDMANMAESLINLTSLKKRVSAEADTVGGPVDVAIISRHEGFIWIKRKHYFDPELNPRYVNGPKAARNNGFGGSAERTTGGQ